MTLHEFNSLSHTQQLLHVVARGTSLARRWEQAQVFHLYHVPGGFFAELHYNPEAGKVLAVRAFTNAQRLEEYAASVQLPEEWT